MEGRPILPFTPDSRRKAFADVNARRADVADGNRPDTAFV